MLESPHHPIIGPRSPASSLEVSSYQLPATSLEVSSYQLPAISFQLPASSYQQEGCLVWNARWLLAAQGPDTLSATALASSASTGG